MIIISTPSFPCLTVWLRHMIRPLHDAPPSKNSIRRDIEGAGWLSNGRSAKGATGDREETVETPREAYASY